MKNDTQAEMWAEMKGSKFKMLFIVILVVGGVYGLTVEGSKIAGITADPVSHSYDEMMKEIYLSDLTSAQQGKKKSEFAGKQVSWTGTVIDVQSSGWGNVVKLSDGDSAAFTDFILEGVPDDEALNLSRGDTIAVKAVVDRIEDGTLTGYVFLTGADIR